MVPARTSVEELGDVAAGRGGAAVPADVAEEDVGERDVDVVGDADDADGRAGPGDRQRGGHGLGGADALHRRVDTDAVGELEHEGVRFVAAGLDDVGGAERAGQRLAGRVAAQGDDPLGAEAVRGEDGGEADGAVTDDGDRAARLDAGADGGVVPGRHHVGQGQQRPQHGVGVAGAGDRDEGAVGERDADGFALAAVDGAVAEVAAGDAADRRAVQAVRAGAVAVDERGDHQVADGDGGDVAADVFDDADELVADRADGVVGLAAVVPEVRPAHAAQHDPHDGVGRLLDDRIRSGPDRDRPGPVEDGCTHQMTPRREVPPRCGPPNHHRAT